MDFKSKQELEKKVYDYIEISKIKYGLSTQIILLQPFELILKGSSVAWKGVLIL